MSLPRGLTFRVAHAGESGAPTRFTPAICLALAVATVALLALGCGRRAAPPPPSVPVTAGIVELRAVPLSLGAVGVVEPVEAVSIKAQVGGVLRHVGFTEGEEVRAGQVLFQIDPRPFEASLRAARAQLERDRAQSANAQVQAERYERLAEMKFVAKQQEDEVRTQAQALKATVQADEAEVEQARLALDYATITSPIAGRAGGLMVKRGNLVKANDASLVTINQMHPIRVSFGIPGTQLPLVQKYAAGRTLEVWVRPTRDGSGPRVKGNLVFVDNAVDTGTATVALKGEFPNEDQALWPGQFVDTELVLAVEEGAVTVPAPAVVTGQEGTFVFVIGPDRKVEKRNVRVNRNLDGVVVVDSGVRPGETVVTDGQMRLVPGSLVEIKTSPTGGEIKK